MHVHPVQSDALVVKDNYNLVMTILLSIRYGDVIKHTIVLSNESGLKTEVVCVCLGFCLFSCWSCLTARTRGRGTSWRPSSTGSMESSWVCGLSSGSRSTTFSCGEWNFQKAADVTGKHVWCHVEAVFVFLSFPLVQVKVKRDLARKAASKHCYNNKCDANNITRRTQTVTEDFICVVFTYFSKCDQHRDVKIGK